MLFTQYIFVFLSTAGIRLIARHCCIAAQQVIRAVRYQRLGWPAVRVRREVESEEPGTDSQLGVVHQGGVQHLGLALFPWQWSSGSCLCGDHSDLHTKDISAMI